MSSKLREHISLFSCSTLSHPHWVLRGPLSHWLCASVLVRSTGISGIWCLIAGSVRFTSLQHPPVKNTVNLPKQTPGWPMGFKWLLPCAGIRLISITGHLCEVFLDVSVLLGRTASPCSFSCRWATALGDWWDGFSSIGKRQWRHAARLSELSCGNTLRGVLLLVGKCEHGQKQLEVR